VLAHRLHERQAQHGGGSRSQANAYGSGKPCLPSGAHGLLGMAQRQSGLPEKSGAGLGGHHAAGRPMEKACAKLALEPADLLAER